MRSNQIQFFKWPAKLRQRLALGSLGVTGDRLPAKQKRKLIRSINRKIRDEVPERIVATG
jgi:hypothetical protein